MSDRGLVDIIIEVLTLYSTYSGGNDRGLMVIVIEVLTLYNAYSGDDEW